MGVNREHSTGVLNLTGCCCKSGYVSSACSYGARCADEGEGKSPLSLRLDCIVKKKREKCRGVLHLAWK